MIMKVKEILIKVSKILDLKELENYLTHDIEITDDINNDINKLLMATNMINGIIASQYFEIIDNVNINVNNNFIAYADISDKGIIEIKCVTNSDGSPIEYKLYNNGLYVSANNINIKFSYFPKEVTIDDAIDCYMRLNDYVFAQGVVSEYLFLKGDFEESYIWDKRFKNSLNSIMRPKRSIITPAKEWL